MSFPDALDRPSGLWRFRDDHETVGPVRFVAPGEVTGREFGLFESAAAPGRPG